MAYIGPLPAETFTSFATQEFSTSATTSYTLDHAVTNENELALFINNVRQQPGSGKAYTASGTALTLSAATASTDTMYAVFLGRALQTVNPADASVGTAKLAATSVTAAKLNNDIISGTTALAEAPADTDEFLVSDAGTLKRIDYSLIKGGGAFEKLITTTASGSSSITFDNTYFTTTYRDYRVVCSHIRPASNDKVFQMTISSDNGSSFVSSNYQYADFGIDVENDTFRVHRSNGQDRFYIEFGNNFGTGTGETLNMDMMIYDPLNQSSNNQYFMYHGQLSYVAENAEFTGGIIQGVNKNSSTAAYDAIKFQFDSGNITDGTITLYGRKN